MGKLVHTVEGATIREYPLTEGKIRIGRNLDCEVQLNDDAVSGHHAEISIKPSQYMEGLMDVWAKDLGSTNGTIVNGAPIKRTMLKHDDVIQIGTHSFRFVDEHAVAKMRTRILISE